MSNSLTRDFAADLEIRSDGTGRTVHGIVVPYGQVARVSDGGAPYDEMFAPGAFARDIQTRAGDFRRVKLLLQHNPNDLIGVCTELREDGGGLYGSFLMSGNKGRDALELVRDGALDAFSVGFRPMQHEQRGGTTVRTKAGIKESSLVTFPAYSGAAVAGVRALANDDAALAQQLLTVLAVADAQLDPIVDALCAADGALDMAQAVIAQILGVPNPDDVADDESTVVSGDLAGPAAEADIASMGPISMKSDSLISLARRLDAAIVARTSTTPTGPGEPDPREHSGRLIVTRNSLRVALIERGIL